MRLPINGKKNNNEFVNFINKIDKNLRSSFEESIKKRSRNYKNEGHVG